MRNETIFQFFHWYYSTEGNLWIHAKEQAARLASLGVTQVWLPPAYKSARGADEPGYAVYDLYDLGEFDQKGTVRTRYGTKQEYIDCIKAFHDNGIRVLADIVLNHKMGGDEKETVLVREVDEENRMQFSGDSYATEAHTRFTFPGRKGQYSAYIWDQHSFTGICEDGKVAMLLHEHTQGAWDDVPEKQKGNYDYLMGNDIEFRNPAVREELKRWGQWYVATTGVDGFRLDALKHISPGFYPEWLDHLNAAFSKKLLCIGEYWQTNVDHLLQYLDVTGNRIQLFDVPLHYNLHTASEEGSSYDLRQLLPGTLTAIQPMQSISFVDNHDTQPLQSLQSPVKPWFKPMAYAFILLREAAIPCIFYPAIYGAQYFDQRDGEEVYVELPPLSCVERMMMVRKDLAYGDQIEYFDHPQVIGWVRRGTDEHPGSGCAVVISNGSDGYKHMQMGAGHKGRIMTDCCGGRPEKIVLGNDGEADFPVSGSGVAVWTFKDFNA